MSHRSGLSCGVFDPGTTMFKAYNEQKVLNPATTLAQMIDALADPPLALHPGVSWEYSVATDVMARLIDDISGRDLISSSNRGFSLRLAWWTPRLRFHPKKCSA